MAAPLCQCLGRLSLGSQVSARASTSASAPAARLSFASSSLRGQTLTATRRSSTVTRAAGLVVFAKQNSIRRQRTAEVARVYNKARKSAVATRMRKVLRALEELTKAPPASEAELAPVEKLISEAYQEIDKAVVKGVLHKNTGARRKSRLGQAKRRVLVSAGLYTPAQA